MNSTERKNSYQILAALFSYPEQNLLDNLQPYLDELSALLQMPIPAELKTSINLTDLEVAYTGLFINRLGGAPAPPYGSIYLDAGSQLMGASCVQVEDCYRSENLNLDNSAEPADFLPTELEFLFYLVDAEESAAAEAIGTWQQKQSQFCAQSLHPWLPDFSQRIIDADGGHPLYRWAATGLLKFTLQEQKLLSAA